MEKGFSFDQDVFGSDLIKVWFTSFQNLLRAQFTLPKGNTRRSRACLGRGAIWSGSRAVLTKDTSPLGRQLYPTLTVGWWWQNVGNVRRRQDFPSLLVHCDKRGFPVNTPGPLSHLSLLPEVTRGVNRSQLFMFLWWVVLIYQNCGLSSKSFCT